MKRLESGSFAPGHQLSGDTPAVTVSPGVAAITSVEGLRTRFMRAFLSQHYSRYQEAKLRQRKQEIDESGVKCFNGIIDLCRKVDPDAGMLEEAKVDYLFQGLKPTSVEKILVTSPKTVAEFLNTEKLHVLASELAI